MGGNDVVKKPRAWASDRFVAVPSSSLILAPALCRCQMRSSRMNHLTLRIYLREAIRIRTLAPPSPVTGFITLADSLSYMEGGSLCCRVAHGRVCERRYHDVNRRPFELEGVAYTKEGLKDQSCSRSNEYIFMVWVCTHLVGNENGLPLMVTDTHAPQSPGNPSPSLSVGAR